MKANKNESLLRIAEKRRDIDAREHERFFKAATSRFTHFSY